MKSVAIPSIFKSVPAFVAALPLLASAQETPIPQGCSTTSAQLQANKNVVLEFFRPDTPLQQRIALVDPGYVQHNPRHVKLAAEDHVSAYEHFKQFFTQVTAPRTAVKTKAPAPPGTSPQPVIVMAECDLVTAIFKITLQDPTAAPGSNYEAFNFDTFRVRSGKLVEHWDGATISEEIMRTLRKVLEKSSSSAPKGSADAASRSDS